jgi:hypothetical protein
MSPASRACALRDCPAQCRTSGHSASIDASIAKNILLIINTNLKEWLIYVSYVKLVLINLRPEKLIAWKYGLLFINHKIMILFFQIKYDTIVRFNCDNSELITFYGTNWIIATIFRLQYLLNTIESFFKYLQIFMSTPFTR